MRLSLCLDPGRSWSDLSALARLADEGSWHAVYVCDHFMPHDEDDRAAAGPMLECWTTLSALAALTRRVRLGPLVLGNTYRHPAVVANMAATLDQVTGGRVVLGMGAGWQRNEHEAFGIPLPAPQERVEALDEACRVIRSLLVDETVTFEGSHYRLDDARCEPKPVQQHVPLLIGGTGPRMLALAVSHADIWHSWSEPDELRARNATLDALCLAVAREPSSLLRATGGTVEVHGSVPASTTAEPADVCGSLEQVAERLRAYAAAGADEFVVVDDASGTRPDQAAELVALLGGELTSTFG